MGVHALFLDFEKAFDMVDHGILMCKLAEFNINKSFWLWIRSFLEGTSQQVKLRGTLSSVMPCPAGVPQGSVMSPILFNVRFSDLEDSVPDSLVVDTWKYAYDCTQDESVQLDATSHMPEVLDAMHTWADNSKMILNSKKSKGMWIYFGNRIAEPSSPLTTGGEMIERVSSFKLLGVWHQNNLKWNTHIENNRQKCRQMIVLS